MEKLKKYTVAVVAAVVMIIGFSAYGLAEKKVETAVNQQWHRVLNEDSEFEWRTGAPSSTSCEPSEDICNVILPSGLNPSEMTTQQIKDNAVDGQYETGYTFE